MGGGRGGGRVPVDQSILDFMQFFMIVVCYVINRMLAAPFLEGWCPGLQSILGHSLHIICPGIEYFLRSKKRLKNIFAAVVISLTVIMFGF